MTETNTIHYVRNNEIDKQKWDACIDNADNGLIYAYSFYLDHMSKQWDGLVLNDYEAVMPLTWNKKMGIAYLYQPFLSAQLGIFGKKLSEKTVKAFILAIPSKFKLIEILLNSGNIFNIPNDSSTLQSNYELDLSKPYTNLSQSYNENTRRNIRKAQQVGNTSQKDFDVEKVITLAVRQMKTYGEESAENVNRFRKLYAFLHEKKMATTYGIFSPENELIASCVFFFSHNRAYYILVGNSSDGRSTGASHALIDTFIQDHAGKNMILDFEGSDIPTLAQFYGSFGASHKEYPAIKINRLPFFLKWMKK